MSQRVMVTPQSWGPGERAEGAARALIEYGVGVICEIHSAHTEYWTSDSLPAGQVEIWASKTYKGQLEYVTTLENPADPFDWADLRAWMES